MAALGRDFAKSDFNEKLPQSITVATAGHTWRHATREMSDLSQSHELCSAVS